MTAVLATAILLGSWTTPNAMPTSGPGTGVDVVMEPGASESGSLSASSTVQGIASWYGTSGPGLYAAAGPPLRHGDWRGSRVRVCTPDGGSCVTLRLTDWCACPKRVIDLSADAFRRLAPLSRGLVRVVVTVDNGPTPTPPPTDVAMGEPQGASSGLVDRRPILTGFNRTMRLI